MIVKSPFFQALRDVFRLAPVWIFMAHQDVVSKYRRTALGPWWITLGTGIGLAAMGLIWGRMFRMPLQELFPYLTTGFIIWGFISSTLVESSDIFIRAASMLKTIKIPLLVFVFFSVIKNLYVMAHNLVIIILVLIIFQVTPTWATLLVVPGFILLIVTALLVSLILGLLGARLRDLSHVITALLTFVFLLTPIMWNTKILTGRSIYLAYLNPITHYLSIIRDPLLGQNPSVISYAAVGGCIVILGVLGMVLYNRYHRRLIFWI